MQIIDRSKLTPKFVYKPTSDFKTEVDKIRHYEKELDRFYNGYRGLNGFHYFILTQTLLKVGTGGEIQRPIYRETDEGVTSFFLKCVADNKNGLWLSRREYGKSFFSAAFQAYNVIINPHCIQVATSEKVQKVFNYFQDKFLIAMSGIDPYLRPVEVNEGNTKNTMYRKFSQRYLDNYGKEQVAYSKFYGVETSEKPSSPTNISSQRAKTIVIDEIGLHPRAIETLNSADPVVISQGKRTGTIILTGTAEKEAKNENIVKLRQLWDDSENLDILTYFTPFWHSLHLNPDGTSNEKSAREWWEKEYESKSRATNQSSAIAFKKNNPRDIKEALGLSTTGTLPAEVLAQLNHREDWLNSNKINIKQGLLINEGGGKIGFKFNEEGPFRIYELPQKGEEYIAGTDPIPMENVASEDGSQHVTVIYSLLRETIVAIYAERNLNASIVVHNVIMLCDWYNGAKNMIENNAGGNLITGIENAGRKELMCGQPKRMGVYQKQAPGAKRIVGYRKTSGEFVNRLLYELFCDWVLKYFENLYYQEIIKDAGVYLVENTDYIDAFVSVLLYRGELVKQAKKQGQMKQETRTKRYIETINGVNEWVTVTYVVGDMDDE